jgi:hypothetical protein
VGSGLPTALNVHEAAQAVNPAAREPGKILSDPALAQTMDFREPVALILGAVMHFVPQESDPKKIIRTLVDALPSGSYVAATHGTSEYAVRAGTPAVTTFPQVKFLLAPTVVGVRPQNGTHRADET